MAVCFELNLGGRGVQCQLNESTGRHSLKANTPEAENKGFSAAGKEQGHVYPLAEADKAYFLHFMEKGGKPGVT